MQGVLVPQHLLDCGSLSWLKARLVSTTPAPPLLLIPQPGHPGGPSEKCDLGPMGREIDHDKMGV